MSERAVRLCFPAKSEYLLLARLAVASVARGVPFAREDVADLKLAVTEACGNAVRHAYAAGRLDLVVEDRGSGIELPLPEAPEPTERGGMGLAIMRAVVDELEVAPGPGGKGTVVHMTKLAGDPGGGVDTAGRNGSHV
jgi:serine/threonine-protein kinase RsbW